MFERALETLLHLSPLQLQMHYRELDQLWHQFGETLRLHQDIIRGQVAGQYIGVDIVDSAPLRRQQLITAVYLQGLVVEFNMPGHLQLVDMKPEQHKAGKK